VQEGNSRKGVPEIKKDKRMRMRLRTRARIEKAKDALILWRGVIEMRG